MPLLALATVKRGLILFDSQRNIIKRYTMPLSNILIDEIFFEEIKFSRKIKREVKE